ncbi:MAG: hypothetical protein JO227_16250 [Acetobacteraceae bacterium]|nr:hypothetical protein [Acetobacteraceae bacterium]
MDDDLEARLTAHMDAIEGRLMARINDAQERLSERIGAVEKRIDGVDQQIVGLTELARGTNILLSTITGMLTDFGRRITDLEKKG